MSDNYVFPRTKIEDVSVSRMIIGTNWMLGYSHQSPSRDKTITDKFSNPEVFLPTFKAFLDNGVDTVMGPISESPTIIEGIKYTQEKLGKELVIVDTPRFNIDDTPEARREAEKRIKACAEGGAKVCLIHQHFAEQLVNKNKHTLDRLEDYTKMIRDAGMVPGLSSHMPEIIQYCDEQNYDVQTYIQIFNCMGFLMNQEIENIIQIIHSAKKPVLTIKPMAAGRCTPYVGLTFNWNAIREQDMIACGCFNEREALEDIEISRAAFEHRLPDFNIAK